MLFEKLITEELDIIGIMRNRSIKNIFLDRYETNIFLNRVKPIEQLEKEDKFHYLNQTEGIEDRLSAVKILYILDVMASNYEPKGQSTESI